MQTPNNSQTPDSNQTPSNQTLPSRISRRALLRLAAGAAASTGLLGIIGCGAPAASPAAAPAAQPTPPKATAATVKRGGSIIIAQENDPVSLDGQKAQNYSAVQAIEFTYESLTMYDDKLNVVPALAASWENPDPQTYLFKLRDGVKFHNGKELDAEDVKYSFDRLLAKETASPNLSWFDSIDKLEATSKNTVKMTLKNPYPPILANIAALRGSQIMPAGAAEKANLQMTAVGTGPFKIVEYVPQDHVTYQANPDYWDKGMPYVKDMTMKIMVDEDARVAGLRAGQIDYAFLSAEGKNRLKDTKDVTVLEGPRAWLVVHEYNCSRTPLNDVRVRQAIALAVDRQEVIDKAASGAGVLSGPVATGHTDWWIPPEDLKAKYYKQDIAKAKQLLANAGLPNGFKTTIKCSPQYPEFVSATVVFAEQLKKIGIEAQIIQLEWGQFIKEVGAAGSFNFDIQTTARTFYPDPDVYLYQFYHSKGKLNSGYRNAKIDDLLDQGRNVLDHAKRRDIYLQAQDILLQEYPQLWWYVGKNIEGLRNTVKDYAQSFSSRRFSLKHAWLDK